MLAYLARAPYENVFLSDLVRNERSPSTRNGLFAAIVGGHVVGVASFGRQVVLAAEPEALRVFADLAERRRGERGIVGPRAASEHSGISCATGAPSRGSYAIDNS